MGAQKDIPFRVWVQVGDQAPAAIAGGTTPVTVTGIGRLVNVHIDELELRTRIADTLDQAAEQLRALTH